MMYQGVLGTFFFTVTDAEVVTFRDLKQQREIQFAEHKCVSGLPKVQHTGRNLDTLSLTVQLFPLTPLALTVDIRIDALRELAVLESALAEIVHITVNAFIRNDLSLASRVEPLEELIDGLCDEMKLHHVQRIQSGDCTLSQGFVFNDLLTNLERIADHCSNIAVAMIELEMDSFDTHEYLNSLRKTHDRSFEDYFREYRQKYSID